jgi:flagellar motor switch protein FliN/FliY
MIENIDNVLLKDVLGEFVPDSNFSISDYNVSLPHNVMRIILPVDGEKKEIDLYISQDDLKTLGEMITDQKLSVVTENVVMALKVIIKKLGDVLSYFSEYTFGEPLTTEDPAWDERKFYSVEIMKESKSVVIYLSEPASDAPQSSANQSAAGSFKEVQFQSPENNGFGKQDSSVNWDLVLDIPVDIVVELGKTVMTIQDILNLTIGSVVELKKLSGEPVEVMANGRLFAEGEVVVIGDNFGVRLTNIKENAYQAVSKKVA